jgi:hypothetical protein
VQERGERGTSGQDQQMREGWPGGCKREVHGREGPGQERERDWLAHETSRREREGLAGLEGRDQHARAKDRQAGEGAPRE